MHALPDSTFGRSLLALVGVAAATALLGIGVADLAVATAMYLVVVVLTAVLGRWPGIIGLVGSAVAFSYWFVPPRGSFEISDPDAFGLLAAFVVAGVACGLVVTRVNTLRRTAEHHEQAAFDARLAAAVHDSRAGFLSSMTHNLRTPLASIKAAASTLSSPGATLPEESRERLVVTIRDQADRLERLVTKVLQMSRVQAGAIEPDPELTDVAELTRSAVRTLRPVAPDADIRLASDDVVLAVDPELLEVVLVSLLENAIRFAPPGTPIDVECRARADGCVIRVSDHGPGVAPTDVARIFDAFVRIDGEGSGLGLAISRAFTEAQGGVIAVGETPGGGATFTVEIPGPVAAS